MHHALRQVPGGKTIRPLRETALQGMPPHLVNRNSLRKTRAAWSPETPCHGKRLKVGKAFEQHTASKARFAVKSKQTKLNPKRTSERTNKQTTKQATKQATKQTGT